MIKAVKKLKTLYKNLFHVQCTAHLMHNCALQVKSHFSSVDNLIARIKALVHKNRSHSVLFENIGKPPDVIQTIWGSLLKACGWYAKNFLELKRIVLEEIQDDGIIVNRAREAVVDICIPKSLAKIVNQYDSLVQMIDILNSSSTSISEAYKKIKDLNFKEDDALIKNYINSRVSGSDLERIGNYIEDISPFENVLLSNAPSTSVSVERSFSMHKKLLAPDRNFLVDNVEQYLFIYFNSALNC